MQPFLRPLVVTLTVLVCAALLWRVSAPRTAMATGFQTGRYQVVASADGNAWIILDMGTGRFERWLVGSSDRHFVETSQFGATGQTEVRFVRAGAPR